VESDQPTLAQLLVTSTQPRNSINVPLNVQKDGTFKASLPEGQYRITANSQPRNANGSLYAVKAFTYGTADLTRDTVSVTTADSASMNLTFGPTSPIAWSKVTGRVTGLDSSFLAANSLVVTLNGSGLVTNWTSAVKPDGSFEFPKVYPGTYTARITPPNPASAGNLNFGLATATINPSGSDITGLEIAVPRQKDIVGKLTLDGRGLMPRFAIPLAPVAGTSSPQAQYMGIDPKPDGSFTISVLEGTRQVGVPNNLPAGYTLKSMTYGTTDVLKNPMKVAMSDTAELRVTLTTPNLAPVHVGGRLTGVDDAIFARGAVTATMRGIGNIASLTTPVRPDRSFEFPEVFPGTYSVRVAGAGIVNSPDVPVAVASSDLTNIEIAVPRQKEITGRVILEGLAPMPRFQFLTPPSAPTAGLVSSSPVSTPVMLINPQTDGTFRLTLTVGTHYTGAAIGLPAGYTIKSFNYGTTDLLKNPLKVGANDTDELLITLTTPARPPVQVRGHVGGLDEATFARGDVNVSMASASYVSPVNTLVMEDGSFEFQDVFPGNYLARAIGPGVRSLSNVSVNVRNTDIQNVEITVPSQKEVTGRVILEGSGPMPRITLLLAPSSDTSTLVLLQNANISPIAAPTGGIITLPDPIPGPIPGPTLIAANGLSIAPLPDGTFRLAIPEGEQRLGSVNGLPPGYTLKELNYGTTDVLKNPLKIAASDNFEIRAVVTTSNPKPVRVSGRVIGLDNASFDRGSVNMTMTSPTYAAPLNAKIQPDGTFEFSEVYPGNFSLRVMGASLSTSSNPMISVANANVDNLEIRVSPLKLIKGHVSIKDGGPYPVLLFLPIAPASTTSTRPEMDGTFQIWLPEGEFRLNNFFALPSGYRVTSFTYGRTDLLKNPLRVSAGDTDEFQLTLESTATPVKVSGRVEGVDLSTLAKSPVRLTMISSVFVQSLTTEVRSDGTFEFTSVFPASYQMHKDGEQQPGRILASINVRNKDITNLIVNFPK